MGCTFRSVAAILTSSALASCMQVTEPFQARVAQSPLGAHPTEAVASANEIAQVTTSVRVLERSGAPGSTFHLMLSVTNHERHPVSLPSAGCSFLYIVYDESGTQVSPGFTCGYAMFDPLILQAGETLKKEMVWEATTYYYDNGAVTVPLPPGLYQVHAYYTPNWPLAWDTYLSPPSVVRLVESG
jgi:hypothetical protein